MHSRDKLLKHSYAPLQEFHVNCHHGLPCPLYGFRRGLPGLVRSDLVRLDVQSFLRMIESGFLVVAIKLCCEVTHLVQDEDNQEDEKAHSCESPGVRMKPSAKQARTPRMRRLTTRSWPCRNDSSGFQAERCRGLQPGTQARGAPHIATSVASWAPVGNESTRAELDTGCPGQTITGKRRAPQRVPKPPAALWANTAGVVGARVHPRRRVELCV